MNTDVVDIIIDTVPSQLPAFHMAIGRAITRWNSVENALCLVFKKVSTCSDGEIASAIFYTVRDFSDKLELTKSAARISLEKNDMDKFNLLRKRMIIAMEHRNALAHFQLSFKISVGEEVKVEARFISEQGELISESSTTDSTIKPCLFLQPDPADPNEKFRNTRHRQGTKKPLGIKQVVNLNQTFMRLSNDIKSFSEHILHHSKIT